MKSLPVVSECLLQLIGRRFVYCNRTYIAFLPLLNTDVSGLEWSRVYRGCMLSVKRTDAPALSFIGFRENDLNAIKGAGLGSVEERFQATSGHNWGKMSVDGASLRFDVGGKPSFIIPLPDVAQTQQGRDEVLMQFAVDDTGVGDREDALVEVAFHVPKDCSDFGGGADGDEDGNTSVPASKLLFDLVSAYTDTGGVLGEAIATFDSVGVLVPRGRFDVELYSSSLKLVGQAQDFRVQYDSILRIFVLPKVNAPQTMIALCLDPPIRKGQTFYNTVLCQFHNEEETVVELDISDEALAAKNDKGAKLEKSMKGSTPDIFARVVRGLSGAKLTRPGAFKNLDSESPGPALRCSYKSDDGYLYPLERAFFYVQKPPLLIAYDDVDSVEFMRQATGITAAKTFDLAVRTRTGQDHLFRGLVRTEWENLLQWLEAKQIRIENFKEAKRGPGAGPKTYLEEAMDAGMARQAAMESGSERDEGEDEEDEDFAASESSSEDDSADEGSDVSGDATIVPEGEAGSSRPPPAKKAKKDGAGPSVKAQTTKGPSGSEKPARKQRKKKDKDAPKKALSGFMFYSNAVRDQVKADNPGIAFGEVGKKIGEMWKALSAEDRAPYDAKAEEDKSRYAQQMEAYKKSKAAEGGADVDAEAGGDDELMV